MDVDPRLVLAPPLPPFYPLPPTPLLSRFSDWRTNKAWLYSLCLPKAVLQLLWRPEGESEGERRNVPTLAVAGDDSSLRIYKFEGLLKDVEK